MKAPCYIKLLIFILVSECSSFKNERESTQELALDKGLMKIDLPGIPIPWLTRIRFIQISLTRVSKSSHSSFNYYETEIPSLTRNSLHVVLSNLVNMNFA